MPEFDRWWNDLKKHSKRLDCWLRRARELKAELDAGRQFRYFTLCARSMIDVFMLAREGILNYDRDQGILSDVCFCESDAEQFPEIQELIGVESGAFPGDLEELVLFEDTEVTAEYQGLDSMEVILEDEGLDIELRNILLIKRRHLQLKLSFPYDFINLDFCGYYYPHPPDILRINRTVERLLDWQRQPIFSDAILDTAKGIDSFLLSVTCRYDNEFPAQAEARLADLVRQNCEAHGDYKRYLTDDRHIGDLNDWITDDGLDFFLSSWPKEISRLAEQYQWRMEIQEYTHYDRISESGQPYKIACIVCRFRRTGDSTYLQTALHALNLLNRRFIPEIERSSDEGGLLLADLTEIVNLRNHQANLKHRPLLPPP